MSISINSQQNPLTQQIAKPIEEIDFQEEFCKMPDIILPDDKFKIINHIDINEKHLILSTKSGLYLIDLKQSTPYGRKLIIQGDVTHAAFIPNTHYVAYSINKPNETQTLNIFNLKQLKTAARLKLDSQIQQIKPSKSCIGIASLQEIFIIHFPTLKPIYNGPAGNNVNIIFDLSYQGLTLAHNSFNRGELIIKNFTNIKRNHALTERKKSIYSSRLKPSNQKPSQGFNFSSAIQDQQQIEPVININAHIDFLSHINISPNGSKVVTSSLKGTILRVFSTKNGQKLEEFRVGYELVKIVDISFVKDGNVVGCMNSKGIISLFNVSMDKQEIEYETQRKGHKIYTQSNPKSFFSFLSLFYPPFNDSFAFNHYQLINPEFKEDSAENIDPNMNKSFSKSESGFDDQKSEYRENEKFNHSIQELDEEHLEDLGSKNYNKSQSFQSNSSFLLSGDVSQTVKQTEKGNPSQKALPQHKILRQSLKVESSPGTKNRITSPSRTNSLINGSRISSRDKMTRSTSMNKKLSKKRGTTQTNMHKQGEGQKYERLFYNMVSKLYITERNYIWAVKGYHIFGLKYDSFHGGEMVLDRTMKIQ